MNAYDIAGDMDLTIPKRPDRYSMKHVRNKKPPSNAAAQRRSKRKMTKHSRKMNRG